MGNHKGEKNKDWAKAVKSAADKAPPGDYTLTTEEVPPKPEAPIREYIVTLAN